MFERARYLMFMYGPIRFFLTTVTKTFSRDLPNDQRCLVILTCKTHKKEGLTLLCNILDRDFM